jgi:hypothetical protein
MTNNPEKIHAVRSAGIEIARRVSADVPANPHSAEYLATKRNKLGHLFNSDADFLDVSSRSMRGTALLDIGCIASGPGSHLGETANRKG